MYYQTLENIRNSFANASKALEGVEGEEETYQILKELSTEDLTPTEMLNKLRQIGEKNEYPKALTSYFYKMYNDLYSLAEQESKKEALTEELKQKHDEFQEEVAKKGLDYNVNTEGLNFQYGGSANFASMDTTNDKLQSDIDLLDKRIKSLKEDRKTGDPLEEIPTDTYEEITGIREDGLDNPNKTIEKMNDEFDNVNEQVMKTTIYKDISQEDMSNIYNYIADKQTSNALLNVDINYNDNNSVDVFLTLEGTEIDEDIGKIICSFSKSEDFNKEILPLLVSAHVNGGIEHEAIVDKGDLESVNVYEEKLSVSGDEDISLDTAEKLNEAMRERKNNISRRTRTLGNQGYNENGLYAIIILAIVVFIVTFVFLIIFKS